MSDNARKLYDFMVKNRGLIKEACNRAGMLDSNDIDDVQSILMIRFITKSDKAEIPKQLLKVSAFRQAVSFMRARRESSLFEAEQSTELEDPKFMDFINRDSLFRAIEDLDDMDKQLIRLFMEQTSYADIALAIGKSEDFVRSALSHARDRLAESLGVVRVKDKAKARKPKPVDNRALEEFLRDL